MGHGLIIIVCRMLCVRTRVCVRVCVHLCICVRECEIREREEIKRGMVSNDRLYGIVSEIKHRQSVVILHSG